MIEHGGREPRKPAGNKELKVNTPKIVPPPIPSERQSKMET
jgi:hypothetical protein